MDDGNQIPLVSVIVPAHNASGTMRDTMDCLINQTMENIEIIVVENGSTDNTLEIANEYKERFPEKVVVISEEWGNAGNARTVGFKRARADYIYSCDSDDLVEYWAVEWLYNKAVRDECDIVIAQHWSYFDEHKSINNPTGGYTRFIPVEAFLLGHPSSFCVMLIKKTLIERAGDVPTCVFEDVAYISPMASFAKKIGAFRKPIYHYFRREGSLSGTALSPKLADTLIAEKLAIENCNPEYRDVVVAYVAKRIFANMYSRWFMLDELVAHLKGLWPEIENNPYITEKSPWTTQQLQKYAELPDEPMPCIAYINGFKQPPSAAFLSHVREKAFRGLQDVVVLNSETCNIDENAVVRAAYNAGDTEFVGHYFALKKIYESGGIYLDERIEIHAPFNYMRYWNAFFGFIDANTFSDWVFGGRAGNLAFKLLLETYEGEGRYKDKFMTLRDRVRNILVSVFNVQQCKTIRFWYRDGLAVFSPEVMVTQITKLEGHRPALHICSHKFTEFADDEDYVVIKRDTLIWFTKNIKSVSDSSQVSSLKARIKALERSSSWRITYPLRKFSRTRFGHLVSKMYHKLVRFKWKIKKIMRRQNS